MPEDTSSFAERYRERNTEALKLLAESGELTAEAQAAIEAELERRDVRFKKPSEPKPTENEKRRRVRRQMPSRPIQLEEEEEEDQNLTLKIPSAGFGYFLAALIAFFGFLDGGFLTTPLLVIAAYIHWLYCVGRIHHTVQKWTHEQYAVGPIFSVLLHFIPIINVFWFFLWPGLLGAEFRAKGYNPSIGALLGLNTLFGNIFVGLGQNLPGVLIVFLQLDPRSPVYAIGGILSALGIIFLFLTISAVNSDLREIKRSKALTRVTVQAHPSRKTSIKRHRFQPGPGSSPTSASPRRWPRRYRMVYLQPDSRFIEN